ncbi:MAG: ABC transporter permease [Chloroflexota bacterium]
MTEQVRSVDAQVALAGRLPVRPGILRRVLNFARRKPTGAIGAAIIFLMVFTAVFADYIARYDPYLIRTDKLFTPPGPEFWLGTDDFGRDLFSRIVYGSRISLYVGILAVLFGTTNGALWGLISGYFGGRTDFIIQRVMDALMAFPTLVLALAIVAALGQSTTNVIIAVGIVLTPTANRVIRSVVLSIKQNVYIEAARAIGASELRVMFLHVLPNCVAPYIILATTALGTAILAEASLSFLGLGTPPPEPAWGSMLSGAAQRYIRQAPWMAIYPGIAISLAVFAFNMFGDALRDVLDPKLRGR